MGKFEKVEPYKASISEQILEKWGGVRVWSEPKSAVEGARVVGEITRPIEVTVVEEEKDIFGSKLQRAKITYDGHEGWVLAQTIRR